MRKVLKAGLNFVRTTTPREFLIYVFQLNAFEETPTTSSTPTRCQLAELLWVPCHTQTQVYICVRVDVLLTELTVVKTIQVAKEIQDLTKEVTSNPITLKLWHMPEIQHWQDPWQIRSTTTDLKDDLLVDWWSSLLVSITWEGGNAGRQLSGIENLEAETQSNPYQRWRDSVHSGGRGPQLSHSFPNSCCALPPGDRLQRARYMMQYTKSSIPTDSKGEYDAVTKSEGPMLGLSNAKSALQAYQLREQLAESFCRLIWISGDWNLSDALTKKTRVAREGLIQFFKQNIWKLKFDPTFIQSEKEARQMAKAAVKQMQELQALLLVDHDQRKKIELAQLIKPAVMQCFLSIASNLLLAKILGQCCWTSLLPSTWSWENQTH